MSENRRSARSREGLLMASGIRKRKLRTYLVEECVIKQACVDDPGHPIWDLFDAEGPILRLEGYLSRHGGVAVVVFDTPLTGEFSIALVAVEEVVE